MENNAIKEILKDTCSSCYGSDAEPFRCKKCAYKMAIAALKEIQQYRALGTVEELKELRNKTIDEFSEKLLENTPRNWAGGLELGGATCYLSANKVKEIAEQMKGSE